MRRLMLALAASACVVDAAPVPLDLRGDWKTVTCQITGDNMLIDSFGDGVPEMRAESHRIHFAATQDSVAVVDSRTIVDERGLRSVLLVLDDGTSFLMGQPVWEGGPWYQRSFIGDFEIAQCTVRVSLRD